MMEPKPYNMTLEESVYSKCRELVKDEMDWPSYGRTILDQFHIGVIEYEIPRAHTKDGSAYVLKRKELENA